MPPHLPRKRLRDKSPPRQGRTTTKGKGKSGFRQPRKPTLFDDLDATGSSPSVPESSSVLQHLQELDEDDSSLSSLSDVDFEDVHIAKKQKTAAESEDDDDDDDEDEDIEFEDVQAPLPSVLEAPLPSGDLELTLHKDSRISLTNAFGDKKGPSKRERLVRNATHCAHVQTLLWHNAVRNSWLCDPEVQGILVSQLPPRLWEEVERWRRNSGLEPRREDDRQKGDGSKLKSQAKAKGKKPATKPSRDWGEAASRLEAGAVDMSYGDPLFRLMKALAAWWKQSFKITAPGIRKIGYMSLERLDRLTKAFNSGVSGLEQFGERISDLGQFKEHAQTRTGSRDVGAQLFTALLRGLGLEARMVANLQPLGFGWTKMEDADPEADDEENAVDGLKATPHNSARGTPVKSVKSSKTVKQQNPPKQPPRRTSKRGVKPDDTEDSDDIELVEINSDYDSAVEITQTTPQKNATAYDKDLEFPHYWTEVLSPVTHKYLAVDAIVKSVIATNRELIESLEPRGKKADRSRQVMAYVVGFSQDGTAKDVTVRYLKRQMLPGRTKGVRMPIEKVPVYNKHGKVQRYELFDWFESLMRCYTRGDRKRPVTEIDEEEESTDLKPVRPEKKEVKEGEETLQYYKQSPEFVLERHLRREEALLADAAPVKVFRSKGKGGDTVEENVYLRKDVVSVKSAETWHKQGRAPIPGEEPLKRVPYRAATTNRRREIAEAEAATGEKVLQGLYSYDQTDWIIPPPIRNGIIPKNEYGNIDLFVEHMCPEGAVHVPYRGAVKVCKRLKIDYAEAVVDFEFGHRMAVPVIQGVVIAEEYHDQVMEELAKDEAEKSRKEDEKRRNAAISMWRKMLMGVRIIERIQQDHGEIKEDEKIFGHSNSHPVLVMDSRAEVDEDMAGGFLPEGYEEEEAEGPANKTSSFFPVADDEDEEEEGDGSLLVEHRVAEQSPPPAAARPTPRAGAGAKPSSRKKAIPRSASSRRRVAAAVPSSDEDEDGDVEDADGAVDLGGSDSEYQG